MFRFEWMKIHDQLVRNSEFNLIIYFNFFENVTGEAQYVGDITLRSDELFGALVLSSMANCSIESIDPSEALVFRLNAENLNNSKGKLERNCRINWNYRRFFYCQIWSSTYKL